MNQPNTFAERLTASETGLDASLWLPLLKLLAQGDPVDISTIAAATGRSVEDVRGALARVADIEYEDGRVIGQGLTLRPTPHRFEVNGEQLYTWCALDTLIFPALLGTSARVESVTPGTGTAVQVSVGPDGVTTVNPSTAVVSLVNPEDMTSVRSAFCNQVHYFDSPEAAQPWLDAHPDGEIMPVADAYQLGVSMAQTMLEKDAKQHGEPFVMPLTGGSCC